MKLYLGIDVGTFQSKGVLAGADGTILAQAVRSHEMLVPQPGWAEHRPEEDWWGEVASIAQELLAGRDPAVVRAVGLSAIGPCMLPVDAENRPLMNGVLYGVDTRAAAEIEELTSRIGAETILQTGGNALTSQSVGPKILWLRRNRPEIFARTRRIHSSTSFLTERLTGRAVIDHYTAANTGPLYDVAALGYTDRLAGDICPLDWLPEPVWSSEVVGGVTREAAASTGLAPGTPVITGTIDAAAEAISVGVSGPGDMMMMYGSTIFIIEVTDRPVRDPRLWYAPWLFAGQHASMAGLATSGTLTHWFRDRFARELDPDTAFATLAEEAAASPPGAGGLVLLPYFSGERTPIHDPAAKGVLFGLDLTHSRGDIYRAFLEGIAHGTAHVIETYAEAGAAPSRVFAVGGGVKNRIWLQSTSDIAGIPQILRRTSIGASYGDAFLAALAVGDVASADLERWNPVVERIEPKPDPRLDRAYRIFRELYPRTRELMG
ncbi:MAG: carbohydrate kinase [Alphaproteobacteria bacterium]|nr:MAG: carbohydrate kinase [Alphaproteobacteria bacterium]